MYLRYLDGDCLNIYGICSEYKTHLVRCKKKLNNVKRILYVQYTNPSAYPPIEHSSLMLADRGWEVLLLGVEASGSAKDLRLPSHPSIAVKLMPASKSGWRGALHYGNFLAWCVSHLLSWRPTVVYCSDARSYPLGMWASLQNCTTILHEHDPIPVSSEGVGNQLLLFARREFARRASFIIIPQHERARIFLAQTNAEDQRIHVVYNCPSLRELQAQNAQRYEKDTSLVLWYHGAIGKGQLPLSLIDALARVPGDVRLEIAGYETVSTNGYLDVLLTRARDCGVLSRIVFHGAIPNRSDLLRTASRADVGLALFANQFRDPMVGASNKPFDYLACGLSLLTNRTPEWESFYGSKGVSIGCNPDDPDDIANGIRALRDDPTRRRLMAERGLKLVRTEWHYEMQFASVISALEDYF